MNEDVNHAMLVEMRRKNEADAKRAKGRKRMMNLFGVFIIVLLVALFLQYNGQSVIW